MTAKQMLGKRVTVIMHKNDATPGTPCLRASGVLVLPDGEPPFYVVSDYDDNSAVFFDSDVVRIEHENDSSEIRNKCHDYGVEAVIYV